MMTSRHRACTRAILALAQATETQALETTTEPTRKDQPND